MQKRFGGKVISDEIGLPVSGTEEAKKLGLVLPCGAAGRWEA